MTTTPQTVPSGASVAAAAKTMRAHQIRHLPVVDDGRIVGLVSERDIGVVEGLVGFDPQAVTVGDIMARSPYTVAPDTSIADVARGMTETRYGSALVVYNGTLVGIFTTIDVCRVLAASYDANGA